MIFQPTEITIRDQQTIQLTFSSQPSLFLTKSNFSIVSTFSGVSDLEILSIAISGFVITINTRPMFPDNLYLIQLLDVPTQAFQDVNNIELSTATDARSIYFVGVENVNAVRDTMLANLPSNYDTGEQTLVRDVTATMANEINIAAVTLEEIKNDNFISIQVTDELYYRGSGPTDRLKNEGAYNVSRVARTVTGTTSTGSKFFDPVNDPNIPFEIINLRVMQVIETIPNGTSANQFDGFLMTVQHNYVTRLLSVVLNPGSIVYDPSKLGYALLNNNYDRFARPSPALDNNQILLSPLTNGAFPEPTPGDTLIVTYEFDNVGRRVDRSSVSLFSVLEQINERVPASVTNFYLKFPNVVSATGQTVTIGGVAFNISTINLNKHPAFLHELVFNTDSLPSAPGEYAINYAIGQVFVFGTQTEIGTGGIPPVATYYYKDIATPNTDYFISDDGYNVVLNQFSQFAAQPFVIDFSYEDVFTPGTDYLVSSHVEVLNERVNNKLVADFTVEAQFGPVKDVYQILNETTGESYTPGLVEGNQISFAGNVPPATSITLGELAQAGVVDDEILNVLMPTTTPNGLLRVFPIALKNHPILNQRQDGIGSNFSSSIQFTRTDLFLNEFYFNPFETVVLNLGKLKSIGDYLIDYAQGNIYLGVSALQGFDVGHISYAYGVFIPQHKHVLSVSNIGLGTTSTHIIQEYDLGAIKDGQIIPKQLNYGYDTFDGTTLAVNSNSIFICQLQDNFTVHVKNPIKKVYGVYTQNSLDGYNAATLATKNLFNSAVNSFNNTIIDLKTYVVLPVQSDTNPNYYHVIINDVASAVKSIVVIDTGTQLLDTDLHVVKYKNIIVKTVTPLVLNVSATVVLQNTISLMPGDVTAGLDYLLDKAGNQFTILTIPTNPGNTLTVSYSGTLPLINPGSQILDQNGIVVANNMNIISVTQLPDLLYILHYDVFPAGILIGYQVKDSNGNIFTITDVQTASVVVSVPGQIVPVIDPIAKIETQSVLQQSTPALGQTTLLLPLDAPIGIGTNLQIGYVPKLLNDEIAASNANTLSAGGAGMVVDYSVGQFFIDYTHLDDELIISYDWGDNQLDWSVSDTLKANDPYYVSYQYGASRDGLETNFGPLTNVSFLQNAPLSISRETYRIAVSAAIKAFLKGPTHEAIRLLAHAFTQIDPSIEESILNQWIVGRDPLSLQAPTTTGTIVFGNGKYNEGLVITGNNSVQLPGDSSLRLAQGTFSTWFRPNWDGDQADEVVRFNLPTATKTVYYNAHDVLPQDTQQDPWYLVINADAYGTAFVTSNYLEVHNSKNEYTTSNVPVNDGYDGYHYDGYDGYMFSSTLGFHDAFTAFAYANRIGKYAWNRNEQILSVVNDLDVNLIGYVSQLNYVNPAINTIQVANVIIDDGYGKYNTGFYLQKRNQYTTSIILEDVHLNINQPFPQLSPPISVSTILGSSNVTIVSGDINTLSIGQQLIIGAAYPTLTNIIGLSGNTIVMRQQAQATLTGVAINNLDPLSHPGMQDGYGEVHLQDKLGTRSPGTIDERRNGWERQLLIQLQLTPFASGHLMVIGSNDPPLSTKAPVIDFLDSIVPGTDVFVDGYGNVFEVDHVQLPYVWLKKPSASGAPEPLGVITAFRKVAGVQFPDGTLMSTPVNWSQSIEASMIKRNGLITISTNQTSVSGSYVSHRATNTSGTPGITFGAVDLNVDSVIRVQGINYSIYSIFALSDVYIGNTGNNPLNDIVQFKYDMNTTGIPAINQNKYFAIFTSNGSSATSEPEDEVFVKMKVPSSWTLSDGSTSAIFAATPTIKFSATTDGDFIDIVDGYGMTYRIEQENLIQLTAVDSATYVPGNSSILLDGGPELRIAAGKRHYLFDVETPEGALRLYRTGDGQMTAEVQLNDPTLFNISSDISYWKAGQLHHIAMSWRISGPDEMDELHLFIDGDEVPNKVTFGSQMADGYIGQTYAENVIIVPRTLTSATVVNNINGSGLLIPSASPVQPDQTWINKTMVLTGTGPNGFDQQPLIVAAFTSVPGPGRSWVQENAIPALGAGFRINSVFGFSSTNIYAVSDFGHIINWNGTSWVGLTSGVITNLTGVFGPSPSCVFAWGGTTLIVSTNNGATWTNVPNNPSGVGAISALWAFSPTDIWVACANSYIFHTTNGGATAWTNVVNNTFTGAIKSMYGFSATDVYAVGTSNLVAHWDGVSFTPLAGPLGGGAFYNQVWGASSGDVYIGGGDGLGHAAIVHTTNGFATSTIQTLPNPTSGGLVRSLFGGSQGVYAGVAIFPDQLHFAIIKLSTIPDTWIYDYDIYINGNNVESIWVGSNCAMAVGDGGKTVFLSPPAPDDTLVFLSQHGTQVTFNTGPSIPCQYGLATSATAVNTILTHANFGVFKNGTELNSPQSTNPQFRQVSDSQVIELYSVDPTTGNYTEDVTISDTITIRTYGLLAQGIKDRVFQYGSLIRSTPLNVQVFAGGQFINTDVALNNGGPAFITNLPAPIDPTKVIATKILLPKVII